jgi:hypothetical protein
MPISDDNDQLHSTINGQFVEKGQTPPGDGLLSNDDLGAHLSDESRALLDAWTEHAGLVPDPENDDADPFGGESIVNVDSFRDRDDAIEVTDRYGDVWVVMSRETAARLICEDLEDDDRGWLVPSSILAEHTGVDEEVFAVLKELDPDKAGALIDSIISATSSSWEIADAMASKNDEELGHWFATNDTTISIGDETVAFQRQ